MGVLMDHAPKLEIEPLGATPYPDPGNPDMERN